MLTPSCDLLPSTSFSSLIIDSTYQQDHLLPLDPGMSDAEALTLADFGFPDEESVEQAEDSWFVGRQIEEAKPAAHKVKSRSVSEAVDVVSTTKTSGEKSGSGYGFGYAAFRAANPNADGKKRKGRPVGWRKRLHMKPKTEVSNKSPPLTTAIPSKPSETKNDEEDEIKVEAPHAPGADASLPSDCDIQKPDQKPSPRSSAPTSTGYAAFRLANPGAKKVGRPVGWKMGVHAKRKRIEKGTSRGKSSKKPSISEDASEILASIEMREGQKAPFFDQQNGEISTALDQQHNEERSSLQLNSPIYDNVDEGHEAIESDEDSELPAPFWEGVLAAANTSNPTTDLISPEIIIKPELIEGYDRHARRDSAHDTIASCFPSFEATDQPALPDSADEMIQDDGSGSSDMSHFSA